MGEIGRALADPLDGPGGEAPVAQPRRREDESVGVQGERHVPVDVPAVAVAVPTAADGEGVDGGDRSSSRVLVDGDADAFEPHLHEEAEELPVVGGGLVAFDAAQPVDQPVALRAGERVPDVLGGERQCRADRRHLDHPLVDVGVARPPVLGVVGIGAVGQSGDPAVPVGERPAADDERDDAPERSGEALEFGDPLRERRREAPEPHAGPAR